MLNKTTIAAAGLLATALFTHAGAQDAAAPTSDTAEKVELRLNLTKGQEFAFRQSVDIDQDMDMQGMQMSNKIQMTSDFMYEVLDVTEAGTADVRVKFGRVHGSFVSPMMGMDAKFDSNEPSTPSGNPMMDGVLSSFTVNAGEQLEFTVAPDGSISSVRGVEKLVDKMMEANPMAAMSGIDATTVADQMKENMKSMLGDHPPEAIGVGSTWEVNRDMAQMGMEIALKTEYAVSGIDSDVVTIDSTFGGDLSGGQMAQMFSVDEFSGTGATTISRKDGLLLTSQSSMKMNASINGGAQGQGGMVMNVTTSIERIEITASSPTTPSEGEGDQGADDSMGGEMGGGEGE